MKYLCEATDNGDVKQARLDDDDTKRQTRTNFFID